MHFYAATLLSAVALLSLNHIVVGAALEPRTIATNSWPCNPAPSQERFQPDVSPDHACNGPNNGGDHQGSPCKYYEGDGTTV